MSIDKFLDRVKTSTYTCLDFVKEVWKELYGEDITPKLVDGSHMSSVKFFERLSLPVSPCFVLLQKPKIEPHIGIYLDGRVLHLTESGVRFDMLRVAIFGYPTVRYYR